MRPSRLFRNAFLLSTSLLAWSGGSNFRIAAADEPKPGRAYRQLSEALDNGRKRRCETAICWGGSDGNRWAIEPLVELPVGKTFALPTSNGHDSTLGRWINTHDLTVSFAGGLRFWAWDDLFSVSVYFSQPLTNATGFIHVRGSDFEYPVSNVRRPYPGFSLGLLGDTLWLGFDYQELINGESSGHMDSNFMPSALVSRSWSLTVGLATVNTVRWGLGTAASKAESDKRAKEAKDQTEVATKAADDAATAADVATKAADVGASDPSAIKNAQSEVLIAQANIKAAKAQIALASQMAQASGLMEQKRQAIEALEAKVKGAEAKVKDAEAKYINKAFEVLKNPK